MALLLAEKVMLSRSTNPAVSLILQHEGLIALNDHFDLFCIVSISIFPLYLYCQRELLDAGLFLNEKDEGEI